MNKAFHELSLPFSRLSDKNVHVHTMQYQHSIIVDAGCHFEPDLKI